MDALSNSDFPHEAHPQGGVAEGVPAQDFELLSALARALQGSGVASHELERDLGDVAEQLGIRGSFFATPTALFIELERGEQRTTKLLRVEPAELDLGRIVELRAIVDALLAVRLSPARALARLRRFGGSVDPLGGWGIALAHGLAGAGAARLFGGGAAEILAALVIGTVIGALSVAARSRSLSGATARMFEPMAALLAAATANLTAVWFAPVSAATVTLASLIVLVPGLTLTQAMSELTARSLASGSARLLGAATAFMTLGFGAALGRAVAVALVGAPAPVPTASFPEWTIWPAVGAATVAFAILFRANLRDLPWMAGSVAVAMLGTNVAASVVGPQFAASAAALGLGLVANAAARLARRPIAVMLVPGLVMLVPGSLGYRALTMLMDRQTVGGLEVAVDTMVVAVGLVAGLLTANALIPPRRAGRLGARWVARAARWTPHRQ